MEDYLREYHNLKFDTILLEEKINNTKLSKEDSTTMSTKGSEFFGDDHLWNNDSNSFMATSTNTESKGLKSIFQGKTNSKKENNDNETKSDKKINQLGKKLEVSHIEDETLNSINNF